jgi:hypothetical protein
LSTTPADDHIERIVECGAVDAVVPLLTLGDSGTEEAQSAEIRWVCCLLVLAPLLAALTVWLARHTGNMYDAWSCVQWV